MPFSLREVVHTLCRVERQHAAFRGLELIDRIDMNLENATVAARHGVDQLVKAREHQKQAVPERCVLILVLIVFVELVIIAFKHS